MERFRSYNNWLQQRFGQRVYKVIVDAGFTCPNRDGTVAAGGCTYCNNNSFRPPLAIKTNPVRRQVLSGIEYIRRRSGAKKFIIYFQPFTNTHAETDHLYRLYTDAIDHPDVVGLAIGTRPDCVDREKIRMIDEIGRRIFVSLELGVESIHNDTLRRINRGHDYRAFLDAMTLARGRSIHIGAHVILGFPWETREQWLRMADEMSAAGIDFLKVHHLHIVRGTALAAEYARTPFRVLDYEEYLDLLCDFLERLHPSIIIERLFGEAPSELLVAPKWGRTKNEMILGIHRRLAERNVFQGAQCKFSPENPSPARTAARFSNYFRLSTY